MKTIRTIKAIGCHHAFAEDACSNGLPSRERLLWTTAAILCIYFIMSASVLAQTTGSPLDIWHWRMPKPQGNNLIQGAYGNGVYIGTGEGDQAVRSTNLVDWDSYEISALRYDGAYPAVSDLWFGNGQFLALSSLGQPGVAATSQDGINWTNHVSGLPFSFVFSLAGGLSGFVAITTAGVLSSSNGLAWAPVSLVPSDAMDSFFTVSSLNGRFLLTGQKNLWWSDDGVVFRRGATNGPSVLIPAVWGAGQYVAAQGTNIFSSTNTTNWAQRYSSTAVVRDIVYGAGRFLASTATNGVILSTNGLDWASFEPSVNPLSVAYSSIVPGHSGFVVFGRSGNIVSSTNGIDWEPRVEATRNNFRAIACHQGLYVAVGNKGKLVTSLDGTNWTLRTTGTGNDLRAVAASPGRWVAIGDAGILVTSTDGLNWGVGPNTGANLFGLTWASNQFLAVGDFGVILRSSDGLWWETVRTAHDQERLHGITRGPAFYVATGRFTNGPSSSPRIFTSPDALIWMEQSVPNVGLAYVENVFFGNGLYVAVGNPGAILVSADGINWTNTTLPPLVYASSYEELDWVTAGAGTFLVVGYNGTVLTSRNGYDWLLRYTGLAGRNIRSVTYASGVFTAVGNNDTILQSGNVLPRLAIRPAASGAIDLILTGESNRVYAVESSTDLGIWGASFSVTNSSFTTTWQAITTNTSRRFYRALAP